MTNWTLLRSEEIADERIFRLRHDVYRFEPSGAEHQFVVLHSPDWVNVVPLTEDGQVVLVRQFRHGLREVTLEIPGGVIDAGESPQAAAQRELREETGYVAEGVRLLGRVVPNPAFQDNYAYMFVAEKCRRLSEPRPDPLEELEVLLWPLDAIPELIRRGEINHTLVINAFAFLGIFRGFR
ncbi:MAG: NUDIX hydrolase [Thermoguttaceae bacterium]